MDGINLVTVGILISILLFGIKTGLGCGFANLERHEIVMICASYFIVSLFMGFIISSVSWEFLIGISNIGLLFHIILAIFMIIAGIYTQKQWNNGCDVSRSTFLFLSVPCPVCLTVLFMTCTMLAATLDLSGMVIGIIVGSVFFFSALASSFSFRRWGKTPETLGTVMMFLGIFYVLSAVLIPAYMQTKAITLPSLTVDMGTMVTSITILFIIIMAGYVSHHRGG